MIAETLKERFEVIRILGDGGQGRAYLARDTRDGGEVVVKELYLGEAADWKALELFDRETATLRNLAHPAIPDYVDGFHLAGGGRVFLVQEYIEGQNLEVLAEAGELFDETDLREFLGQMLDILAYLHSFSPPVIHRDIKPSNIIRDAFGKYHLVDFGAVQVIVQDEVGGSTIVGTSGFMPPEQLIGRAQPASDIYALAATCVQMVCGVEPGALPMERMKLQFHDKLGLSEPLNNLLDRMLEPQVETRFLDARAVQKALNSGKIEAQAGQLDPPKSYVSTPLTPQTRTSTDVVSAVRDKRANPPIPRPKSDVRLPEDGALHIEIRSVYKIPFLATGIAIFIGCVMVYLGLNDGDGSACCFGIPLVFSSVGYLGYRMIKRFREYVDRLKISRNAIELEAGYRNGAAGELIVTRHVQTPLFELRNCYLHIYSSGGADGLSPQQRAQNRKRSGIYFVDTAGREHAFELAGVLSRGLKWWRADDRQLAEQEATWLFEVVQAQLEALTAVDVEGTKARLQPDGVNRGAIHKEERVTESVEVAESSDGPAW